MNREDRAKQFAPFDALKGLHEELRKREENHNRIDKKIVSETKEKEISESLSSLQKGMQVEIEYYSSGRYRTISGILNRIDFVYRTLTVDETVIDFSDLYRASPL